MNFSTKTKNEIIKREIEKKCCKISLLSGFLRTGAVIEINGGMVGFSVVGEVKVIKFISKLINSSYGDEPVIKIEAGKEQRACLEVFSYTSAKILQDCKILELDDETVSLRADIDKNLVKNACCKIAFITGVFLGSGTVTVPKIDKPSTTGYHLEFVFSKKVTAEEFCDLYSSFDFFPKLIQRKDSYVVYIKNAEGVNDTLTLLGAINSSLALTDLIMRKELKNKLNRAMNCEMSNMTKSIDSSFSDRKAIQVIIDTIKLENLDTNLQAVAKARLLHEDSSLSQLAQILGISKSCLSHRLRKLREIAKELEE